VCLGAFQKKTMSLFDTLDTIADDFLDDYMDAEDPSEQKQTRLNYERKLSKDLKGKMFDGKKIKKIIFGPPKNNRIPVIVNGINFDDHNKLEGKFSESAEFVTYDGRRFIFKTAEGKKVSFDTSVFKAALKKGKASKMVTLDDMSIPYSEGFKIFGKYFDNRELNREDMGYWQKYVEENRKSA